MKKVFLDNLPRKGKRIDWINCIGRTIKFIYDDIEDNVEILNYIKDKSKIVIYNDKYGEFEIFTGHLVDCKLGKYLNKITKEFKVCLNEIVQDEKRYLTITNREYRVDKSGITRKWYKYTCNICGWTEGWIEESGIISGCGCLCCAGQVVVPEKDWRGWRIWNESSIKQIEMLIDKKMTEHIDNSKINNTFTLNNRRYLGSKFKLLDFIHDVVSENCPDIEIVADIFGGTGVVANSFHEEGKTIIVNDLLYSNVLAYTAFFSKGKVNLKKIEKIINKFNSTCVTEDNYFSYNFGNRFFTIENARKIGYIREEIELMKGSLTDKELAILITSLLYATDKVANTCGHYDAYRETLDTTQELKLLIPTIHKGNGKCTIYREDANELVKKIAADLVYIDTPYNSRQYGDAYHLLENLAEWKKPTVIGKAKKMQDRSHIKSKYCTVKAPEAFSDLISNINSKYILVSYNNMAQKGVGRSNAKISNEEIIEILNNKGTVKVFEINYNTFTTGKTNINDHKELLYLCECR